MALKCTQNFIVLVTRLHTISLNAGEPVTMNLTGDVTVLEGDSVSISCFSTGNPVPTITWYLGSSMAQSPQSDTMNNLQGTVNGTQENTVVSFTDGNITSVLRIENIVFPAHNGEYTCVGLNSHREEVNTNNATIVVHVQGKHIKTHSGNPPQHSHSNGNPGCRQAEETVVMRGLLCD